LLVVGFFRLNAQDGGSLLLQINDPETETSLVVSNEWDNIAYEKGNKGVIEEHRNVPQDMLTQLIWREGIPDGYSIGEDGNVRKDDFKDSRYTLDQKPHLRKLPADLLDTLKNSFGLSRRWFLNAFDILCQKTLVHPDAFRKDFGVYDFIKIEKTFKVIFKF
jgi:hypothetical protein